MEEYERIYNKDRDGNKDFNKNAITELKQAHYFFAYLRTSEKLYNRELMKEKQKGVQEKTEEQIIVEANNDSFAKQDEVLGGLTDKNLGQGTPINN